MNILLGTLFSGEYSYFVKSIEAERALTEILEHNAE